MSEYATEFNGIIEKARSLDRPMKVALARADAENILTGLFLAQDDGWAEPILIGNEHKIRATLERLGFGDRKLEIHPIPSGDNSVQYAIEMINAGEADCLMRGNTQTRDFLMPVLNNVNRLVKPDHIVTHMELLHIPGYSKLLAISDVTLLINPTIEGRKHVIRNMVSGLKSLGIEKPVLALLSLVEKPSFQMRDTVEYQTLVSNHQYEPIADCVLVGPIAYDLIISKEAARLKNYDCPYCGEFDGIVMPDLLSGNLLIKVLEHNAGATGCGMLLGTTIPVAITSRSDLPQKSYLSLAACAAMLKDEHL